MYQFVPFIGKTSLMGHALLIPCISFQDNTLFGTMSLLGYALLIQCINIVGTYPLVGTVSLHIVRPLRLILMIMVHPISHH